MHGCADGCAFGAMRAAIDRAVPAGLLARPDAVLHLRQDRAADRTMCADVLPYFDRRAKRRPRHGLGLTHGAEPERGDRGKAAHGETRAPAKGPTLHARSLKCYPCRDGPPPSKLPLPVFAFDQHWTALTSPASRSRSCGRGLLRRIDRA